MSRNSLSLYHANFRFSKEKRHCTLPSAFKLSLLVNLKMTRQLTTQQFLFFFFLIREEQLLEQHSFVFQYISISFPTGWKILLNLVDRYWRYFLYILNKSVLPIKKKDINYLLYPPPCAASRHKSPAGVQKRNRRDIPFPN